MRKRTYRGNQLWWIRNVLHLSVTFLSLQVGVTFFVAVKYKKIVSSVACQALRSLTYKGLNDAQLMSSVKEKVHSSWPATDGGSGKSC